MSTASAAKVAIGVALALMLGCEIQPLNGLDAGSTGSDAATDAGGPRQPIGADALCTKLITECGRPLIQSACLNQYLPMRVIAACANGIAGASCSDLASPTSAFSKTCFPPCTAGAAPVCNGDGTITLCSDSSTVNVLDCRDVCTADGFTAWTGTCGKTFDSQVAQRPQCWCR